VNHPTKLLIAVLIVCRDKTSTKNRRCKVIYSYKESKDDELTLAVGDLVEVFEEVSLGNAGNAIEC
jgi:hypothetical protein